MFKYVTILLTALLVSCAGDAPVDGRQREQVGGYAFVPVEPIIIGNSEWDVIDTIDAIVRIDMRMTLTHPTFNRDAAFDVYYRDLPEMVLDNIKGAVVICSSRKARRDSVGI